ncbi:hypothetical protein K2Z83_15675 [Oscillochloris sp. ZM17-4]|uniref:hypothetical protein n=1 Tax=Oscillochloris sp. ZM17-4 TaxID=2866714 RepID=UPI001C733C60|nr:hypothetical protein [Oscillochloris sp. ZM17-4]MBX0329117.1 hypothetical protein [Oscillochloris sp. ZM17-4]
MSTTPTTVFEKRVGGKTAQVVMYPAAAKVAAHFAITCDGSAPEIIPATRAWRSEQKAAIERACELLGVPVSVFEELKPSAPTGVSGARITKMAALVAQNIRESGSAASPDALLNLGREHAEHWAALGREAFSNEMARLEAEANELCEAWDMAAREKITVY